MLNYGVTNIKIIHLAYYKFYVDGIQGTPLVNCFLNLRLGKFMFMCYAYVCIFGEHKRKQLYLLSEILKRLKYI